MEKTLECTAARQASKHQFINIFPFWVLDSSFAYIVTLHLKVKTICMSTENIKKKKGYTFISLFIKINIMGLVSKESWHLAFSSVLNITYNNKTINTIQTL